ncbi:MAG TPA: orotidine-5'-phosphate decarboxylase [Candidatus Portnoybacteria bacterium]|nr:orotidine-5'-phosphate decarboxylase [Candidatus Portnoybacteria bacterium]
MKELRLEERLIVAADYSPKDFGGIQGVEKKVLALAQELEGLGIYIKINSILRATGYGLITKLHNLGLKVFADLKLIDIPNTIRTDAEMLTEVKPEIITVMCCAGIDGLNTAQETLGNTSKVFGVTVLTSLDEEECQSIFACPSRAGVLRFARIAQLAGLSGLVLSPQETNIISKRPELKLSLNTPGIRPKWSLVEGDDQNQKRVLTPQKAIENGAERIIMGRPITRARLNNQGFLPQNPREAAKWTLEEIEAGLS